VRDTIIDGTPSEICGIFPQRKTVVNFVDADVCVLVGEQI
jgi:hypothetical protein